MLTSNMTDPKRNGDVSGLKNFHPAKMFPAFFSKILYNAETKDTRPDCVKDGPDGEPSFCLRECSLGGRVVHWYGWVPGHFTALTAAVRCCGASLRPACGTG